MIKKIVFDLDNTLIMWKSEYISALKETIDEFNLNSDLLEMNDIIEKLEVNHEILSKEILLEDINKKFNLNLNMDFVNTLFKKQSLFGPINDEVIDTLKYLKNKYELVVLTNYFKEVQVGRLKHAKIYEYFNNVYCGDEVKVKPNKEAFLTSIYPNKIEECIVIGDRLDMDITPATEIGLKAIVIDYKNELPNSDKYVKIKSISDLKEIL